MADPEGKFHKSDSALRVDDQSDTWPPRVNAGASSDSAQCRDALIRWSVGPGDSAAGAWRTVSQRRRGRKRFPSAADVAAPQLRHHTVAIIQNMDQCSSEAQNKATSQ